MKHINLITITLLLLTFNNSISLATEILQPYPGDVPNPTNYGYVLTSDYGPRNTGQPKATKFHPGLDYAVPNDPDCENGSIRLLKDGEVESIEHGTIYSVKIRVLKPDYYNTIEDSCYYLKHLHLFFTGDAPLEADNGWIITTTVSGTKTYYAIVRLAVKPGGGYYDDRAQYIRLYPTFSKANCLTL